MSEFEDKNSKRLSEALDGITRDDTVRLGIAICDAVLKAEPEGGCHGGIRPDNITLTPSGVVIGPELNSTREEMTPEQLEYIAPELFWSGKRSPAADVYSVGLVLYAALNGGRLPFIPAHGEISDNDRAAALQKRMKGRDLPPLRNKGKKLQAAVNRALSFNEDERYKDLAEMKTALENCPVMPVAIAAAPTSGGEDASAISGKEAFGKAEDEMSEIEKMMAGILASSTAASVELDPAQLRALEEELEPEPEPEPRPEPEPEPEPEQKSAPESTKDPDPVPEPQPEVKKQTEEEREDEIVPVIMSAVMAEMATEPEPELTGEVDARIFSKDYVPPKINKTPAAKKPEAVKPEPPKPASGKPSPAGQAKAPASGKKYSVDKEFEIKETQKAKKKRSVFGFVILLALVALVIAAILIMKSCGTLDNIFAGQPSSSPTEILPIIDPSAMPSDTAKPVESTKPSDTAKPETSDDVDPAEPSQNTGDITASPDASAVPSPGQSVSPAVSPVPGGVTTPKPSAPVQTPAPTAKPQPTATPAPTPTPTQSPKSASSGNYTMYVENCSWTDAKAKCEALGGHLAVISDSTELQIVIDLAEQLGVKYIWLGAKRGSSGTEMEWVTGESIDYYPWDVNEPSYSDSYTGVKEDYLMLWRVSWGNHTSWTYNDSRNDPVSAYPSIYGGKIAYICEFD